MRGKLATVWQRSRWMPRWQPRRPDWHPAVLMSVTFTAIGLALTLQPDRFANTPSYANLLVITGQMVWGLIYLGCAALLGMSLLPLPRRHKWTIAVAAHTVSIALTGFWLAAFVVRYVTDEGTTIVNVASWSVYFALLVRSVLTLPDRMDTRE